MKISLATALILFLSVAASCQQIEVTGAYQFNHLEAGAFGFSDSTNFPVGASANINVPVVAWIGVTADVGWTQKSLTQDSITVTSRLWTYGGGPQFTYRKNTNAQPFVRMIFGAGSLHGSVSGFGSASSTAFFFGPGGGVDVRLMRHVWLRAGLDYFHADKQGVSVNGLQVIGGLQFRFGKSGREDIETNQTRVPNGNTTNQQRTSVETSSLNPGTAIPLLGLVVSPGRNGACDVQNVAAGSVSAVAGLHPGDVITQIDGKSVQTPTELAAQLSNHTAGDTIRIGYLVRGYWQAETSVTLPTTH